MARGELISRHQLAADPRVVGVECAITFAGKELPEVDALHDHSVAEPIAGCPGSQP
jgi:hypothetical protein